MHWQIYKQQIKVTKNSTPHKGKQRTKIKLDVNGHEITRNIDNGTTVEKKELQDFIL